ncbi:MAG: AAA family ATPase [Candidatus Kaiserbacteria bacterium]|nr:AAA family ATPase [Candidatus Kaiserbacteria bacterium]
MKLKSELRYYAPAIALDSIISRRGRKKIQKFLTGALVILGGTLIGLVSYTSVIHGAFDTDVLVQGAHVLAGIFFILLGLALVLFSINAFYRTRYFRGTLMTAKEDFTDEEGITYDVAKVCFSGKKDLTHGFLVSTYGEEILARLGVSQSLIEAFLQSPRARIQAKSLPLARGRFTSIFDVGAYLYSEDVAFKEFLFSHGITEEHFLGTCSWVSRVRILHRSQIRWWSRDNLGKAQGLGRELSYGIAYELKRYLRDIHVTSALSVMLTHVRYAREVVEKLEVVLSRSKSANVILVGDAGVGKMDMLIEFASRIREGRSVDALTAKRLLVFDTSAFVATHNSKEEFEHAFLSLMVGAENAGNIIMVIEDLPGFLTSVASFGSDGSDLLERFLTSPLIQVIATATPDEFHTKLETEGSLLRFLEPIHIEVPDLLNVIHVLEEAVWKYENAHGCFFTYASLSRIAMCAEQYLVEGVMPDKALNLLSEIATVAGSKNGRGIITSEFVDSYVQEKIGMPVGLVASHERDMLLHLEEELHQRIVGQHDAVLAISNTMRRARAGIQNMHRPLGSFLFLGPTGVGKTETAKALTELFFKSEDNMVRFDMSEFSGDKSVERLIGTHTRAGELSSTLREHPYCVLLLDEFEKASREVHDVFLQILDEGMFTDGRGQRVNVRNCIIVATSNAGSSYIWKLIEEGKRPHDERNAIINEIVSSHIFRPELINRFDASIIFSVLTTEEQKQIADIMLQGLRERMREKGYELVVDDVLRSALAKVGYDAEFGARPMRRAIQDIIEAKIASKIIEGSLKVGERIQFVPSDFE